MLENSWRTNFLGSIDNEMYKIPIGRIYKYIVRKSITALLVDANETQIKIQIAQNR
jgi:hypothetical protein